MTSYCRIYGIMAREAPLCVLFRRGPTRWTQIITWHTDTDRFKFGAWFHGRIYERRSDVSPDGKHLIYFAAKFNPRTLADTNGYTYAWTAISKPPSLTALALWPKGDCWHGGGLFTTNDAVWLNHRPDAAMPHPAHAAVRFKVTPNPEACGEDAPVLERRLAREGWVLREGHSAMAARDKSSQRAPEFWELPARSGRLLRAKLLALYASYGRPRTEPFSLIEKNGTAVPIAGAQWADLDQLGRLVFAREGRLYRASINKGALREHELVDLNTQQPPRRTAQERVPPGSPGASS